MQKLFRLYFSLFFLFLWVTLSAPVSFCGTIQTEGPLNNNIFTEMAARFEGEVLEMDAEELAEVRRHLDRIHPVPNFLFSVALAFGIIFGVSLLIINRQAIYDFFSGIVQDISSEFTKFLLELARQGARERIRSISAASPETQQAFFEYLTNRYSSTRIE